ncbi:MULTISPECIES: co-chaperone YbbN [Oceanobacillus]|uniref:thioredoxin family protein n=1 Tax=Oceanobacillus TaxID=182709 RepID=UPI000788FEEF|nr:thioredoxin family protein [Oceanobacillus sojae]MCT1905151.1 thioredoxin family protein [Oceanobacillus sojae]
MVKELRANEFDTLVTAAEKPVVLKFTADWCPGCKQLAPVVESVAEELEEEIAFYHVDVDEELEFAQQYQVMSIPTLILFKNGEEADRVTAPEASEEVVRDFSLQ